MQHLIGEVDKVVFLNEENGFGVIRVRPNGSDDVVTVVGTLPFVSVGASVNIKGEWKNNSKYGQQFCVREYEEIPPATVEGIEKYLGSGLIKGIGPTYAKRIVKKFGEDTIRVIEDEPDRLLEIDGIGVKKLEMIKNAWEEQKEIKNVMIFLQSNDVSTSYAVKIFKAYGNASIKMVKDNPYRLTDDIWGIGFKTADKIAQKIGFEITSYERCRSGIIYILNELSNEGHCFSTKDVLVERAKELLGVDDSFISFAIERMVVEKSIIFDESDAFYIPSLYFSEVGIARRIAQVASTRSMFQTEHIDGIVDEVQREYDIVYDEVQLEAVKAAAKSKVMVLTGGPGTGKTTTTVAILRVFNKLGARISLVAPTGRAAKRMSEITGTEAKTIHRLLEYKPPEGYRRNIENPLDCDVLIVDEASMVDVILGYNLLQALPDSSIIVFVGDVDQLPPIGAGNMLRDIIDSGVVQVIHLKRIFRQAQGSAIVTNAHKINKGDMPILSGGEDRDFFYIEEDDPQKVVNVIKDLCLERLPNYYGLDSVNDIQVLCPMQKGVVGVKNLNVVLQEALNPSDCFIKHGGTQYRINDKVMQIKNNYEKNVFNGDIGTIVSINAEDKTIVIKFDEDYIDYEITEMDEITLAYATTIHKSQGSEYPIVVAPMTLQHYIMLTRNLIYTCVTRAKKAFILVGTKKAIAISVANDKMQKRNTMLSQRIRERWILT